MMENRSDRYMRAWVAGGGPARASSLRAAHHLPPVPPATMLMWSKYATRNAPTTVRTAVMSVKKPTESKADRHARATAITSQIDATMFVEDMKMIVRGRKALAKTGASLSARAFELSGDPSAFDD